jgi:hypothetical protein
LKPAALLCLFFVCTTFPQSVREAVKPQSTSPGAAVNDEGGLYEDTSYYSEEEYKEDPGVYTLRKPSQESIDKFRKDKELSYTESEGPSNLLELISKWINEQIMKLIQSKGFWLLQEYLSYIIAAAALLIVIFILNKNKLSGIVYGIKNSETNRFRESHEDINKIDFDALISSYITKKEFKIAARYCYLQCLKLLSDRKVISWQINKTNRQYTREIRNTELQESFEQLTSFFEWIWYGDYPLEELSFYQTRENFTKFYGRLEMLK